MKKRARNGQKFLSEKGTVRCHNAVDSHFSLIS